MSQNSLLPISSELSEKVDKQIQDNQKITDFEIREWPIEVLVQKFITGIETDESEIFIPDYQREFIWTAKQQSRFIESIMIHLPVIARFCSGCPKRPFPKPLHWVVMVGAGASHTMRPYTPAEFLPLSFV
jgi:hypothetical protein